jgi:2-polyprenyl-3-methyl-5-hydroxy-6-metoxy-1,4-benzoquinol methylase
VIAEQLTPPDATVDAMFEPVTACWVCGSDRLTRFHRAPLDFRRYVDEDRDLFQYTGHGVWLVRCAGCGFGQPAALPTLERFFDRMYAQRWSAEWVEAEFNATYKDFIFHGILDHLARRRVATTATLLDVGAHAGRFMWIAQQAGWRVEGIELNPRTAAFAQTRTGAPVHHINAQALARDGRRFDTVVLTDVLEHIPEPLSLLTTLRSLVRPGGSIAVKVPNGPAQWQKERLLAALTRHRVSLAENLVHVNHFSSGSLRLALQRAGFSDVQVHPAAPELPGTSRLRDRLARTMRLATFGAASTLPGGTHTPLALNLQAYATRTDE